MICMMVMARIAVIPDSQGLHLKIRQPNENKASTSIAVVKINDILTYISRPYMIYIRAV
jgi:hypothetical protein